MFSENHSKHDVLTSEIATSGQLDIYIQSTWPRRI